MGKETGVGNSMNVREKQPALSNSAKVMGKDTAVSNGAKVMANENAVSNALVQGTSEMETNKTNNDSTPQAGESP